MNANLSFFIPVRTAHASPITAPNGYNDLKYPIHAPSNEPPYKILIDLYILHILDILIMYGSEADFEEFKKQIKINKTYYVSVLVAGLAGVTSFIFATLYDILFFRYMENKKV